MQNPLNGVYNHVRPECTHATHPGLEGQAPRVCAVAVRAGVMQPPAKCSQCV